MTTWLPRTTVTPTRANLDLVPDHYYDPRDDALVVSSVLSQSGALAATFAKAAVLGGRVWLPQGVIGITPGLVVPPNVMLMGSPGTTLRVLDGTALATPIISLSTGSAIRGFTIDGNKANTTIEASAGVEALNIADFLIADMIVKNTWDDGVLIINSTDFMLKNIKSRGHNRSGLDISKSTNGVIESIESSGNTRMGVFVDDGGVGTARLTFKAIHALNNLISGVQISGRLCTDVELDDILAYGNTADGVRLTSVDEILLSNIRSILNGGAGLFFYASRNNVVSGLKTKNNSQAGNGSEYETHFANDGAIFSSNNIITGAQSIIQATIKAGGSVLEDTANDGPNYISGGRMDVGVSSIVTFAHPKSRVMMVGGIRDSARKQLAINANYTVLPLDEYIRTTGTIAVVLPTPVGSDKPITLFKTDTATTVTVTAAGGALLNGAASVTLTTQYTAKTFVANGTTYDVI